jgi:hypothetical protein
MPSVDSAKGEKRFLTMITAGTYSPVAFAKIAPTTQLASMSHSSDFDGEFPGTFVAYICSDRAYRKLGLRPGNNYLYIYHRAGAGEDSSAWHGVMRHTLSSAPAPRPDDDSLRLSGRDTTGHERGYARFHWIDRDEEVWLSCGEGCCYLIKSDM